MAIRDAAREIVAIQNRLAIEPLNAGGRGILLRRQAEIWERNFPETPFERIAKRAQIAA
jgi:hypothetical protein